MDSGKQQVANARSVDELLLSQLDIDESKIQRVRKDVRKKFFNLDDTVDTAKAIRISELLVTKQQKEHLNPKYIFNRIYYDKRVAFQKIMTSYPEFINDTDAVGASAVHVSYLYKRYEIGRWLVEHFPDEALRPYSDHSTYAGLPNNYMPYAGENILHMTIIRRNIPEVRWLLTFYRDRKDCVPSIAKRLKAAARKIDNGNVPQTGAEASDEMIDYKQNGLQILLNAKVKGTFFSRDGKFYCGETPLHFAVCSNCTEMFDLVLSYALSEDPLAIFGRDSHGNTLLHLCIMHDLAEMYTHVRGHAEAVMRKLLEKACSISRLTGKPVFLEELDCPHGYAPRESKVSPPSNPSLFNEWVKQEVKHKVSERLDLVLNEDLHSPLTLAASTGGSMLGFLINQLKVDRWTYGPVSVSLVDLDGLEVPHNHLRYGPAPSDLEKKVIDNSPEYNTTEYNNGPFSNNNRYSSITNAVPMNTGSVVRRNLPANVKLYSAIERLCIHDDIDNFELPFVKDIISVKWERTAFSKFQRSGILGFIIALLVTVISCLINYIPTTTDLAGGHYALVILYPITAILLLILAFAELPLVLQYGLDYWGVYGGVRGAAVYEKVCMTFLNLSFFILCVLETYHANRKDGNSRSYLDNGTGKAILDDVGIEVTLVLCLMSAWSYLFFIFMGFDATGPFVLKIYKIITTDVPFFLQFYLIVIAAFSCAVCMISNMNQEAFNGMTVFYGFRRLLYTAWTFIKITVNADFTGSVVEISNVPSDLWWVFDILLTLYSFTSSLLMINLLIAIIGNSYDAYDSTAGALLLKEKYNIMCSMERGMSEEEKKRILECYSIGEEVNLDSGTADIDDEVSSLHKKNSKLNLISHLPSISGKLDHGKVVPVESEERISERAVTGIKLIPETDDDSDSDDDAEDFADVTFSLKAEDVFRTYGSVISTFRKYFLKQNSKNINLSKRVVTRWNYKWEINDRDWFQNKVMPLTQSEKMMDPLMNLKVVLLIIDPQNDFYDHTRSPAPSLPVTGACADALRISKMIMDNMDYIDEIYVTLDTHHKLHIAHGGFWQDNDGKSPDPFTIVSHEDVMNKKWFPRSTNELEKAKLYKHALAYTKELEAKGNYQLCIWPEHCLIGTPGHAIVPEIYDALSKWSEANTKQVHFVYKSENKLTEMYSALEAEVVIENDDGTKFNKELMGKLNISDKLIVCGEAKSHCVNFTVRDIVKFWHKEMNNICVLNDGCSPVPLPSFIADGNKFISDMERLGVTICNCDEVFDLFRKNLG